LIYSFLAVLFTAFLIIITFNKVPIQNWISFCLFDTGIFSFLVFQNAVYNQHRLNMLESFRKVSGFNLHSFIIMGLMMLVFGAILLISCVFSDDSVIYSMLILGIIFTISAPLWLRNIYKRFLKRRYINMNGFRTINY